MVGRHDLHISSVQYVTTGPSAAESQSVPLNSQ